MTFEEYLEELKMIKKYIKNKIDEQMACEISQELKLVKKRLEHMGSLEKKFGNKKGFLANWDYYRVEKNLKSHFSIINNLIDNREMCDLLTDLYLEDSMAKYWMQEYNNNLYGFLD